MRVSRRLTGVPSLQLMGSKALSRASRLGGKGLYQLSDLAGFLDSLRH